MLAKKRKVYLAHDQFIFGIGVKVMVKYLVQELPEGKGFKLSVVSDKKKYKSFFKTTQNYFIEGNTLYSHGLRLFPFTKKRDKPGLASFHKKKLVEKLDVISGIAKQVKNAGEHKTIAISKIIDEAFVQMSAHDKGIKNMVKKYFQE
jgi:hypothetical protein